jgi:hypothetical protein
MKIQMIQRGVGQNGCRYFSNVIKNTPGDEKFALPFLEIRD